MEYTPDEAMSYRLFVEGWKAGRTTGTIEGDQAKYITKVLRLQKGDSLTLCTEEGLEYCAVIRGCEKKGVIVETGEGERVNRESPLDITLCQALPKAKKMDYIVQKGTELGVTRFVPFIADRSTSRPDAAKSAGKSDRWRKIALEAARQCGRQVIPDVANPLSWQRLLARYSSCSEAGTLKLAAFEGEERHTLRGVSLAIPGRVILIVGPEGGFSRGEMDEAREVGFEPVSLGPRILRTETAGMAMVALLQFLWGDMGQVRTGRPPLGR